MAEVYDFVEGVAGSSVSHVMPNGDVKTGKANQLERVIALHEDVQRKLLKEGKAIFQRADFRMNAKHAREEFRLREQLAKAVQTGDPTFIHYAQEQLDEFNTEKTKVTWSQADVDFHVHLFREDGNELHVEIDNKFGRGGLHILEDSLTH